MVFLCVFDKTWQHHCDTNNLKLFCCCFFVNSNQNQTQCVVVALFYSVARKHHHFAGTNSLKLKMLLILLKLTSLIINSFRKTYKCMWCLKTFPPTVGLSVCLVIQSFIHVISPLRLQVHRPQSVCQQESRTMCSHICQI